MVDRSGPFARARRGHGWLGQDHSRVVAALGLAWVQVRPNLSDHLAGAPQGASVAPVARCAWFSAAHAAAPSFSPGAARSGIAQGPVPSRPVIPGSTHLPWEGRSTAHALDLERANAARDRSAEITSVGWQLLWLQRVGGPARCHRSAGRPSVESTKDGVVVAPPFQEGPTATASGTEQP